MGGRRRLVYQGNARNGLVISFLGLEGAGRPPESRRGVDSVRLIRARCKVVHIFPLASWSVPNLVALLSLPCRQARNPASHITGLERRRSSPLREHVLDRFSRLSARRHVGCSDHRIRMPGGCESRRVRREERCEIGTLPSSPGWSARAPSKPERRAVSP